jgi:hypothetical protein
MPLNADTPLRALPSMLPVSITTFVFWLTAFEPNPVDNNNIKKIICLKDILLTNQQRSYSNISSSGQAVELLCARSFGVASKYEAESTDLFLRKLIICPRRKSNDGFSSKAPK